MRVIIIRLFSLTLAILMMCGARESWAGAVFLDALEVEPNDSLLNPQIISPFPSLPLNGLGVLEIDGSISIGDVDFFQVHFPQAASTSIVASQSSPGTPLFAIFDSTGAMIASSSGGTGAFVSPGVYTYAITGPGDAGFTGDHAASFSYDLFLNWRVIPSPAAAMVLAGGCLLHSARRRKS